MRLRECAETVEQVQAKNTKCGYTNKAQTITVWAFSNFAIILRTTICEKLIDT